MAPNRRLRGANNPRRFVTDWRSKHNGKTRERERARRLAQVGHGEQVCQGNDLAGRQAVFRRAKARRRALYLAEEARRMVEREKARRG